MSEQPLRVWEVWCDDCEIDWHTEDGEAADEFLRQHAHPSGLDE